MNATTYPALFNPNTDGICANCATPPSAHRWIGPAPVYCPTEDRPNVIRHEPGLAPDGTLACAWCREAIGEHRADYEKEEGRAPSKLELAGWLLERGREEEDLTMAAHLWLAGQAVVNA
jgi:hypothetical protein